MNRNLAFPISAILLTVVAIISAPHVEAVHFHSALAKLRPSSRIEFLASLPRTNFALGEPIPLTISVRNVTSEAITVNARLLINDADIPAPFREVALDITSETGNVGFIWAIYPTYPDAKDFVKLAPSQSISRTEDIAVLYSLTQRGQYKLEATYENVLRGPIVFDVNAGKFLDQDIGAAKTQLRSTTLTFTVD